MAHVRQRTPDAARRTATLALGLVAAVVLAAGGCRDEPEVSQAAETPAPSGERPDEVPVMLNREPPFRYPQALYEKRVQGNVTLHLFIDRDGQVRPESTRVEESSGYASLDSAAVKGSQELRFSPAKKGSEPMPVAILFPVFFRHPEAPALPGDTVLKKK